MYMLFNLNTFSWKSMQPTAGRLSFVIRVYDDAGNVIETHEHTGDFKEW
jgi:hypothetical protein